MENFTFGFVVGLMVGLFLMAYLGMVLPARARTKQLTQEIKTKEHQGLNELEY